MAFLISPSPDSTAQCPLPISVSLENKWRWDAYRGMTEHHIFKFRQEIPETRPRGHFRVSPSFCSTTCPAQPKAAVGNCTHFLCAFNDPSDFLEEDHPDCTCIHSLIMGTDASNRLAGKNRVRGSLGRGTQEKGWGALGRRRREETAGSSHHTYFDVLE